MPPRKDTTGDDLPPTVSDQLSQLIIATNSSSSHTAAQLTALIETTTNLATQITKLTDNITTDSFRNGTPKSTDDSSSSNNRRPTPKPPKINLPLFDGSNPLGWIFQAENYFSYYKVPPEERIELTAFHLVGDALSWYQNLAHNDLLGTWPTFKRDLELRFGPSTYENHKATLFKLQQTASVSEYQTEFERVSNRVTGLSREALRDCYISGLRADIQNELALHKPASLHAACALSRLIEDKLNPNPKPKTFSYNKPTYTSWAPSLSSSSTITSPPQSNPKPSPPLLPTPMKSSSSLPVTRLSLEAIAQRRKDDLCFRWPERYTPGHKCSPPQFLFIVDNDDPDPDPTETEPTPTTDQPHPKMMSLSDAAFFGLASTQTLRVTGYIAGKPVTVLVDCGSTHSILQPRVASQLQLESKSIVPFSVMVGNGQFIQCTGYCIR
ncbi:putative retrotransposon gag domain, aspartic peptidase domain superfamily [Helianthus annuus]|nr:putative retrotransposon gag domain, aspartic peptidase domain superfamily [Helianthus annuus]KAJ0722815.1 putative retrotransposon gag domain, aspartic peptidase domain superfamily [Helianthus annuus]